MPDKPLLLVDVDGVLLPWGNDIPANYCEVALSSEGIVWWDPENANRLRLLCGVFDPVWCTARFDDVCSTVASLHSIGGNWPVIEFPTVHRTDDEFFIDGLRPGWKLEWVQTYVAGRAFAWLDDDLPANVVAWANRRSATSGRPSHLEWVDPREGFNHQHFERLMRFAIAVQAQRAG